MNLCDKTDNLEEKIFDGETYLFCPECTDKLEKEILRKYDQEIDSGIQQIKTGQEIIKNAIMERNIYLNEVKNKSIKN